MCLATNYTYAKYIWQFFFWWGCIGPLVVMTSYAHVAWRNKILRTINLMKLMTKRNLTNDLSSQLNLKLDVNPFQGMVTNKSLNQIWNSTPIWKHHKNVVNCCSGCSVSSVLELNHQVQLDNVLYITPPVWLWVTPSNKNYPTIIHKQASKT
jgi:hypothetical protein